METIILVIIIIAAFGYVFYIYGGAIKGLFFNKKSQKVKLACGHCVGCPSHKSCDHKTE